MSPFKLLLLDVDGVLTNGRKVYDREHIPLYKEFMCKDFTAIKRFMAAGVNIIMISGDQWNKTMAEKRNIEFFCTRDKNLSLDNMKPCAKRSEANIFLILSHIDTTTLGVEIDLFIVKC